MAFLAGLALQRFLGFLSVFLLLGGSRRGSGVQGNGAPAQGLAGGGLNFLPSVMIPNGGFLRLNGSGSRNVCRGEFRPRVRHGILLRSCFGGGILPDAVRRFVPRGGCLFLLRCTVYMYGRLLCLLCAFLALCGLLRVLLRRFGGGGKLAGARIGARLVIEGLPQLAGRFLHRHHLGGTVFARAVRVFARSAFGVFLRAGKHARLRRFLRFAHRSGRGLTRGGGRRGRRLFHRSGGLLALRFRCGRSGLCGHVLRRFRLCRCGFLPLRLLLLRQENRGRGRAEAGLCRFPLCAARCLEGLPGAARLGGTSVRRFAARGGFVRVQHGQARKLAGARLHCRRGFVLFRSGGLLLGLRPARFFQHTGGCLGVVRAAFGALGFLALVHGEEISFAVLAVFVKADLFHRTGQAGMALGAHLVRARGQIVVAVLPVAVEKIGIRGIFTAARGTVEIHGFFVSALVFLAAFEVKILVGVFLIVGHVQERILLFLLLAKGKQAAQAFAARSLRGFLRIVLRQILGGDHAVVFLRLFVCRARRFRFFLFLFRIQRYTAGSRLRFRRCLVCGLFFAGRHIIQSRLCNILRLGRVGAAVAHICEDFFQRKILAVFSIIRHCCFSAPFPPWRQRARIPARWRAAS